ncbi:hypothetical protein AB0B31_15175 [Catellatospora citrea]|uniref:hypothetical protein n=1 Tax=Catellatospora citrea TaxID=53366 RepID=UPI0033C34B63
MSHDLALKTSASMKTYVIEAHTTEPEALLRSLDARVEATDDALLYTARIDDGKFWIDQIDDRFWRFHTDMTNTQAFGPLKEWVSSRRDLDWMWLPSAHLRRMWDGARSRRIRADFRGIGLVAPNAAAQDVRLGVRGADAEQLLDDLAALPRYESAVTCDAVELEFSDPNFGYVREGVDRRGRFAASGDSLELHLTFVNRVVDRYRNLVTLCEQKALRWNRLSGEDSGATFAGGPILIHFSREIDDLDMFADELTSCREPFRLWGDVTTTRHGREIAAVDLHVGQPLQFDIGKRWMRIYLREGYCGNTVARLISNLQHRFDGALRLADPELERAIQGPLAVG